MNPNSLDGRVDFPDAYGLAVSIDRLRHARLTDCRRAKKCNHLSEITCDGAELVVRFHPTTPESASELQPIVTSTAIVLYEGRVDNRGEIARALSQPHLASESDGRVLAAAFEAWGETLSARVIGEYAYVAVDRQTRKLVAGQDSLGVRRLFYCTVGKRLLVTSNLRLLFERFPSARPSYDRTTLREYFTGPMLPWSGATIWRGVRELRRGNVLVQKDGGDTEERNVWRPDPQRREHFKSSSDVDERFREVLFEAVRVSLRTRGPILCDISGGFDSSTIASISSLLIERGEGRGPIVGWSHITKRSNERLFQELVQQKYKISAQTLDLADYLPFQVFCDTEIPTGGFIQMGALDRAAREFAVARGISSHLTGVAADALFHKRGGGPPIYLADWFRQGKVRQWLNHFIAYLNGGSISAWRLLRDCTVGTLDLHAGIRRPLPDWLTPKFRREIREARHDFLYRQPRVFRSDARERMYRFTLCFMPYGGAGVPDERMPFVHRPLVEFLLGLDWEHLASPNDERLLMKRSLSKILPEKILTGECRAAFIAHLHEGLRAAWPRISPMVTGEQLAELGVVDLRAFQLAIDKMRAGYEGLNPQVTRTAIGLETWLGFKALGLRPTSPSRA